MKKVLILICFIFIFGITTFIFYYSKNDYHLIGEEYVFLELNTPYEELGIQAKHCTFSSCTDISKEITIEGTVDTTKVGNYQINYFYQDKKVLSRTIRVSENQFPVLTLNGGEDLYLCPGTNFEDPGYTALDNYDGNITEKVIVKKYSQGFFYIVADSSGNTVSRFRTIKEEDNEAPTITLDNSEDLYLEIGKTYEEVSFSAFDNCDGNITDKLEIISNLDSTKVGEYEVEYRISDSSGNSSSIKRTITVYEKTPEEIISDNEDELARYIRSKGYKVSIGYYNLVNGSTYTYRPSTVYYGASLIKTLVALYTYENLTLTDELKGWVKNAIEVSNNPAYLSLYDTIGYQNLRNYGLSMGAQYTLLGGDKFGSTTVYDQLAYMKYLYNYVNTAENGTELKQYFINDFHKHLNFNGAPTIMHKYGYWQTYFHDVGIVLDDTPYIVVILTTEGKNNYADIISDLSQKIYEMHNSI